MAKWEEGEQPKKLDAEEIRRRVNEKMVEWGKQQGKAHSEGEGAVRMVECLVNVIPGVVRDIVQEQAGAIEALVAGNAENIKKILMITELQENTIKALSLTVEVLSQNAMSKRDQMAAAVLTGMTASDYAIHNISGIEKDPGETTQALTARVAYIMADAMLAEREKGAGK